MTEIGRQGDEVTEIGRQDDEVTEIGRQGDEETQIMLGHKGCTETSIRNCHYTVRNMAEDRIT